MRARKPYAMRVSGAKVWDNGGTTKDGPGPAASTAGGSQGLADRHVRSEID